MPIRTIFTMVEECGRGQRQGWQEFVRDYGPLARVLLAHYFPTLRPELVAHVTGVLQRARADQNAWFRGLRFTNEREFLMSFRELVFAYGRIVARVPAPEVSMEQARELLRSLTVVERELLWLFVKGYEVPQVAAILMNAEATAVAVGKMAQERLERLLPGGAAHDGLARVLMELAEKSATPECLSVKVFNNLINGQISWQARDRAKQHIGECLYCTDRFTSLQEMIWYQRNTQPLSESEVEAIMPRLGLSSKQKGLVGGLLSRRA